jgi:D-amino peptidase
MRIYLMTDMEGVAGVLDSANWCLPASRYYDAGRELLTREVNAAVAGFFAGGVTEVVVADGHGAGAIDPQRLDPRADLMRGWPTGYPYLLDASFQAVAWVGQHAMSRSEYAHLAHTGSFAKFEYTINGRAVGEFGQFALCAAELGVPCLFAAGDRAFCLEAQALVPDMETVAVKRGTTPGRGDECDATQYAARNTAAIHQSPERARHAIQAGAERAARRMAAAPFGRISLQPPFEMVKRYRPQGDRPAATLRGTHATSVIALMNSLPVDPPAR